VPGVSLETGTLQRGYSARSQPLFYFLRHSHPCKPPFPALCNFRIPRLSNAPVPDSPPRPWAPPFVCARICAICFRKHPDHSATFRCLLSSVSLLPRPPMAATAPTRLIQVPSRNAKIYPPSLPVHTFSTLSTAVSICFQGLLWAVMLDFLVALSPWFNIMSNWLRPLFRRPGHSYPMFDRRWVFTPPLGPPSPSFIFCFLATLFRNPPKFFSPRDSLGSLWLSPRLQYTFFFFERYRIDFYLSHFTPPCRPIATHFFFLVFL